MPCCDTRSRHMWRSWYECDASVLVVAMHCLYTVSVYTFPSPPAQHQASADANRTCLKPSICCHNMHAYIWSECVLVRKLIHSTRGTVNIGRCLAGAIAPVQQLLRALSSSWFPQTPVAEFSLHDGAYKWTPSDTAVLAAGKSSINALAGSGCRRECLRQAI